MTASLILEKSVKQYGVLERILTDPTTWLILLEEFALYCNEFGTDHFIASVTDQQRLARLKRSTKRAKPSLVSSSSTGHSYSTTIITDLTNY